jgi:hypothetical protein
MLFDSGQTYDGRAYRDSIASAHAHGVPIVLARRGDAGESSDARLMATTGPCHPEQRRRTAAIADLGGDHSTRLGMTCENDLHADVTMPA